ncbi:uncharacterized protein [Halyomorpha halys]|uniref:uncharacterized protein n=1 Tax=Halyomorpha halys TaxID=286706 RepID=UPI0006D4CA9F|nr:uncharacterized protein LOC106691186 [Halyomorpha halys]
MRERINKAAPCVRVPVMSATALIAAVKKRSPLWDPTDVHHHNRVVVAGLWRQIAQELGLNMILAKSKWRGLRDYYRQQFKRAMEQPEGQVGSTWAHFEEMSFLGPSLSSAARGVKEEPTSGSPDLDISEAMEQKWSPPWSYKPYQDSEISDTDEDDLYFFKSLLPDLRGLPRKKKALIRLKIQKVVYEEVYGGWVCAEEGEERPEEEEAKEDSRGSHNR